MLRGEILSVTFGRLLFEVDELQFELVEVGTHVGREHVFTRLLEHDFVRSLLFHYILRAESALEHVGDPV